MVVRLLVHGDGLALGAREWPRAACRVAGFWPAWALSDALAPAIGALVELPVAAESLEDGFGDELSLVRR